MRETELQPPENLETFLNVVRALPRHVQASFENWARLAPDTLSQMLEHLTYDAVDADAAGLGLEVDVALSKIGAEYPEDPAQWNNFRIPLQGHWFKNGPNWSLADLVTSASTEPSDNDGTVAETLQKLASLHATEADDPALENLMEVARAALRRAMLDSLRAQGVLRGPCPRCGRPEWATEYRSPKAPGRPPLDHTYCPTCVELIKREQRAESKRRARSEGRAI